MQRTTFICTIATANSVKDLQVFFFTLNLFNVEFPDVFVLCDDVVHDYLNTSQPYRGKLHCYNRLNYASGFDRKKMERMPGTKYPTLWEDFMMEKTEIMDIAFRQGAGSVLFLDSDICFMGALPDFALLASHRIGVCRHMIIPEDEVKYGRYNAGYVWTSDPTLPSRWREAAKDSHFFDQVALEKTVDLSLSENADSVYFFPVQHNYGWWRMFQGTNSPAELKKRWNTRLHSSPSHSGIYIDNAPLLSIHTHWKTTDRVTRKFNRWVFRLLKQLKKHEPALKISHYLRHEFSYLKWQL